jgi:hypothetical protein
MLRAEASVDIDCPTFDRVLLWLEAETLGRPLPDHDIRITEELVGAADVLGGEGRGEGNGNDATYRNMYKSSH